MESLHLIKIHSPFDKSKRFSEVKEFKATSLLELRNSEVPLDVEFIVSVNGQVIPTENLALVSVKQGDCVVFTPKIQGDFGDVFRTIAMIAVIVAASYYIGPAAYAWAAPESIAGMTIAEASLAFALADVAQALAVAGTILAGSMLVNAVLPGARPPNIAGSDYERSQTYSWTPTTLQQQGSAIPHIYGKHRVYGNVIQGYIDSGEGISTDKQKLNLLIGLGIGPVKAISNISINDQAASTYSGLIIDSRLGNLTQTTISLFDATKITYVSNREVKTDSPYTYTTSDNDFDGLEIVLSFPRGVYFADDSGGISNHEVKVAIEIRNISTGESFRSVAFSTASTTAAATGIWSYGIWVANFSTDPPTQVWYEVSQGSTDYGEHYEGEGFSDGSYGWRWLESTASYVVEPPLDYLSIKVANTSAFTYTKRISGLTHGVYEVKITKRSADVNSVRYGDSVRLGSVIEVYNSSYTYPRLALVGIQALASEQISGTIKFSSDVYGKLIRVYRADEVLGTDGRNYRCKTAHVSSSSTRPVTGASWSTYWEQYGHSALSLVSGSTGVAWVSGTSYSATASWRVEYSDNPAWVAFDILTQPVLNDDLTVARYDAYNPSYLNTASFQTWADYCDTLVDDGASGYERRITFNGVFDSALNVWDAVLSVCQMAYACPVWTGTTIKIVVDQARTSTQLFTIGNVLEDTFKEVFLSLSERAGELEVEFTDRDQDFERTSLTLVDTTADRPSNKTNKYLFGVTKTSEANRLGYRYLAYNKYQTRLIDFQADVDAIACEVGDRIDLSHDVPQWGVGGRVVSATTGSAVVNATVVADRTITIAAGKTGSDYTIKIRLTNDTIVSKTLASSMTAGDYTTLTINGYFTSGTPSQYDPYVVGLTATVVKPVIVTGIRKTSDQTVGLTCVDYYGEVYTFDSGKTFTTPVDYSSLNRLVTITSVTATERSSINSVTGEIERNILIEYEAGTNAICRGASIRVLETSGGRTFLVETLFTTTKQAIFKKAKPATTYTFVVQGLNINNEYSPLTVSGDLNRYSLTTTSDNDALRSVYKVVGLQIVGDNPNATTFTGKDVLFKWNRILTTNTSFNAGSETYGAATSAPDILFKHYVVQIYESNGTTKRGKSYILSEALFTYSFTQNVKDGSGTPVSSFTIGVDIVNIFNEKTTKTAKLTVSNTTPTAVSSINVNFASKHLVLDWTKTTETDFDYYLLKLNGFEKKLADNSYVYTIDENKKDNTTADASVTYSIQVIDVFGNISTAVTGTATNTAPAPTASIISEGWMKSAQFTWAPSTELDFSHFLYRLQVDSDGWGGWTEGAGTFIHRPLTVAEVAAHGSEVEVYIEVKVVDSYNQESSVVSSNVTTLGLNVSPTDIADFAITASKIFTKIPIISGDSWTDNSPIAGKVAWNQHTLYYNGAAYTIAASNTSYKYIYWDGSSSAYTASDTNPGLTDGQFVISTNVSGVHDLAWNAIANEVIGTAYIQNLAVSDAKISNLSVAKLTAGEIAVGQYIRGGQTAYNTGTGFFLGITAGGVPQFSIGDATSYLTYTESALSIKGNIVITGGSGYTNLSDSITNTNQLTDGANLGGTATWDGVSGANKPDDNATVGADWDSNLANVPGPLQSVSGAGLYLNSSYLGYYDGSVWTTYLTSSGNFYASGNIYGSSFQTKGTYLAASCSSGASSITVGSTADFASSGTALVLDGSADEFTYTGKTSTTFTGCSGLTAHTVSSTNKPLVASLTQKGIYISDALNEMWFIGDRGDGTNEVLCTIGFTTDGSDTYAAVFGSPNGTKCGVLAKTAGAYAVVGRNFDTLYGTGVYGLADGDTAIGVHGECNAEDGTGVIGDADGTGGWGVYGLATGSNGIGVNGRSTSYYGVYGYNQSGSYAMYADGDMYVVDDCSALTFTDRTPYYEGDALSAIKKIEGRNGKIDHDTLPSFARKTIRRDILKEESRKDKKTGKTISYKRKVGEETEPGRDLGAMISILTVGLQQVLNRLEKLEGKKGPN